METVVWVAGQKPPSKRSKVAWQADAAVRHYARIAGRIYKSYVLLVSA